MGNHGKSLGKYDALEKGGQCVQLQGGAQGPPTKTQRRTKIVLAISSLGNPAILHTVMICDGPYSEFQPR